MKLTPHKVRPFLSFPQKKCGKLCTRSDLMRGFGLIEILVASAIISASFISLIAVANSSFRLVSGNVYRVQAEFLAEEGVEVVRILRDESWSGNLSGVLDGTIYYPIFNTSLSVWSITETDPGLIDGTFSRTLFFEDVYRRDSDDDIVALASPDTKTLDAGTKRVTSRVLWNGGDKQVEFVTYITNMFQN